MYTSRYTGDEIDNALGVARSIGKNQGVPVGNGNGSVSIRKLDTILSRASTGIPSSEAVMAVIDSRTSTFLIFKGTVANAAALPADPSIGDVYHVAATNKNVAWNGEAWSDVGQIGAVDIKPEDIGAVSKEEFDSLTPDKIGAVATDDEMSLADILAASNLTGKIPTAQALKDTAIYNSGTVNCSYGIVVSWQKIGRLVSVSIGGGGKQACPTGWVTLCTIPEIAPVEDRYDTRSVQNAAKNFLISITTAGAVRINYTSGSPAATDYYNCTRWLVARDY